MENHDNNPNKRQVKDNGFEAQKKIVFKSFHERPKTMLMVSNETGILRANICRYVAEWRGLSRIGATKKDYCKITKHLADYLTTNPDLFPKSKQLNLF